MFVYFTELPDEPGINPICFPAELTSQDSVSANTFVAIGVELAEPHPPCSIIQVTTYLGFGYGPITAAHE